MRSQSYMARRAAARRSAGTPTEWSSIIETTTSSLPLVANSGQYSATGASRSSCPRSARMWAHSAVAPFVQEYTTTRVSASHGRSVDGSATPPHRSTTVRPSTVTHTAAPTSSRSAKLRASSSRTASKPDSHTPEMATVMALPSASATPST